MYGRPAGLKLYAVDQREMYASKPPCEFVVCGGGDKKHANKDAFGS